VKDTAHYIKIVEWSEEDKCYIGSSPGLFYGGCHGEDEQAVFRELCQIVEETIADMHANEQPLPPATTWRGLVSRQDVA
jgi:predicted RNase H-like HicB family nuclease